MASPVTYLEKRCQQTRINVIWKECARLVLAEHAEEKPQSLAALHCRADISPCAGARPRHYCGEQARALRSLLKPSSH